MGQFRYSMLLALTTLVFLLGGASGRVEAQWINIDTPTTHDASEGTPFPLTPGGTYTVAGSVGAGSSDNIYVKMYNTGDPNDLTLYHGQQISPVPTSGMPPRWSNNVTMPTSATLAPGSYVFTITAELRTGTNVDASDSIKVRIIIMEP